VGSLGLNPQPQILDLCQVPMTFQSSNPTAKALKHPINSTNFFKAGAFLPLLFLLFCSTSSSESSELLFEIGQVSAVISGLIVCQIYTDLSLFIFFVALIRAFLLVRPPLVGAGEPSLDVKKLSCFITALVLLSNSTYFSSDDRLSLFSSLSSAF